MSHTHYHFPPLHVLYNILLRNNNSAIGISGFDYKYKKRKFYEVYEYLGKGHKQINGKIFLKFNPVSVT